MNRTIKEATVKCCHYDSHEQLRTQLNDFIAAYNFGRRLKTLKGLTPYEYIFKIWTSEPERFIINPTHQIPGLNTQTYPARAASTLTAAQVGGYVVFLSPSCRRGSRSGFTDWHGDCLRLNAGCEDAVVERASPDGPKD
ncbi:hypothetical protein GCM10007867_27590 [Gluconobacter cerinus]|uniref:Integrase catalytic domain-containing protein n=1 Tax=Gluconobacter cerinus TaxID=38307 RepID=A0AAV5NIV5_9PROT|nr:hypothetical protein GCM10007867_27590 [Gluconobacter cerinus]